MTRYARIDEGLVVEIIETDLDITTLYHPALIWVPCDNNVQYGWSWDGQIFIPALSTSTSL